MCGIAGFCGAGDYSDIRTMTDALAHRGPDGFGYHADKAHRLFLGHRRLAILDIRGGTQPMWNETTSIAVIFNGEIYNHVELRAELERRGHRFASDHSDTEVLVHGYEEWGEDLPLRLNGMFAFAVWDSEKAQLFLARDRFGEKPLFYSSGKGFFAFSSELRSLAAHRGFDASLDVRSLQKLFAYGFFPAPRTPYRHAAKLPGGSWLRFDLRSDTVTTHRYWQFSLVPDEAMFSRKEDDLVDELDHLVTQSVRRRLISDVPIGVFLSGGVDSSTVLAAATDIVGKGRLETFTIGFNERSFDESVYASRVAKIFQSLHNEQKLDLAQARNLIPTLLDKVGEPLGDSSLLPTYLLCEFARRKVTVALSGDGADELFAGYDPFHALRTASIYKSGVPNVLHGIIRSFVGRLPVSTRNMSLEFKLKRTLAGLSYGPELWNPTWLAPLASVRIEQLFDERIHTEELYEEALALWNGSPRLGLVDKTLEFYTQFYLQDGILTKVDRAAMMNSLEARAIFLDNDLVYFSSRLPTAFKYRNGTGKYLLKKVLMRKVPTDLVSRPKKGFGIPLAAWLREIPERIPLEAIAGIDLAEVDKMWQQHRNRRSNDAIALWVWLCLQAFHRRAATE
ncbi:asparagine synthase (glutamine-hydrolyzing) [Bradyrhizobium sp. NBAIM14]|uniref:asparagine synthase (glutamine-hydrolyzing) n=1 Tax=Bradyrhizobium sp. NBAIM14 TaxID=2793814 RepID=UPI001CD74A35|nr:asparagine synthase (glutamine-hydrolyzing) [Bradyrhizobium sp. NBAIM14]MCA1501835.1 asparagine synthase (glutamine-hydrolyzing) [Bradyrhizobium sp. NBAIM14]